MNIDLSKLSDDHIKEETILINRALAIKAAENDMSAFCKIMMPDPEHPEDATKSEYQVVGHSKMLCNIVENLHEGKTTRVAVSVPPQHGKPVEENQSVLMGDGSRKKLKDVVVGDYVITKLGRPRRVMNVFKQGELECVKLNTRSGRSVTAALDHPMLTTEGWVKAGDIKTGMFLASVVPDINKDVSTNRELCEARLIGYFIGDGNCTNNAAVITVVDEIELQDIIYCAETIGFTYKLSKPTNRAHGISLSGGVRPWLKNLGIKGCNSHTKFVPEKIFTSNLDVISNFLGAYFACDGTIGKKGLDRHGKQRKDICAEFYSVSERLIDDVQHLLLRLGVQTTKAVKKGKYKGGLHLSYRLSLTGQDNVIKFAGSVPIYNEKRENLKHWGIFRRTFDSLLIADEVVSIDTGLYGQCRCLSVDEDKSFVANEFVVHNTISLSQLGLAWIWGKNPKARIIVATYNQTRANELGHDFRQMIKDRPVYHQIFPDVQLQQDAKSKEQMINTKGGKIFFIGVGGTITGRTADYVIIDDPYKGDDDEFTQTHLERIWGWFFKVAYSRGSNKTRICVIHTRWAEDDLIGRLCDPSHPERNKRFNGIAADWTHLNIPGVIKDKKLADALGLELEVQTDPRVISQFGSEPMVALWAKEKSLAFFAQWKRGDPRSFSALVMGSPTPDDGMYFSDDMVVEYGPEDLPTNLRYYGASDHAVSEKQQRDYTVLGCVGIDEHDDIWILPDLVMDRMQTDRTVEELLQQMVTYRPTIWWMENEMISKSFGPFLRKRMMETRTYCMVQPVTPTKDKMSRARSIQGRMAMKKVHFPRFAPWFLDAKNQLMKFPYGAHDDFVDWLAHIGLGLTQELSAESYAKPVGNVPKTGTGAWVIANSEVTARREALQKKNKGW